ncbi:Autophagy protein 5 [Emydomyces testavorans]|uniref:Autophagy protein 5 n=1 Tax=Emydomyces testavorans TaxID=2070801 RepID=A0AAF0IJB3_9EURO|nr:Autophagy protein 5 [Emydomyces testavorans]
MHFKGFTLAHVTKFGTIASGFGVAAGILAVFFLGDVPRVREDILMKIPVIGGYWERHIDPEDNISVPRLSYLPFLLPRLLAFFSSSLIDPDIPAHEGWFSFESVPLKWHYPVGLLYDLYAGAEAITSKSSSAPEVRPRACHARGDDDDEPGGGALAGSSLLPWRLTIHFHDWPAQDLIRLDAEGKVLHDAFINSVKEADFLRNGTAKRIMALSREDSWGLWRSVEEHNLPTYHRIHNTLLLPSPPTPFRNIPMRIFLPNPSPSPASAPALKVIQSPIPPLLHPTVTSSPSSSSIASISPRPLQTQPQTIGTALNALLPSLFPSKRIPVLAKPVLHGAVVPMSAPVEEVVRCAGYADGWLGVVISMVG